MKSNLSERKALSRQAKDFFEGNRAAARRWMRQPARAMNGVAPEEASKTTEGIQKVKRILTALEYGVYL